VTIYIAGLLIKLYSFNCSAHITNLMRFGLLSGSICDTKMM